MLITSANNLQRNSKMIVNRKLASRKNEETIRRFFEDALAILQRHGWQWKNSFKKTEHGIISTICARKNSETHIVVSVDVEQMLQEIVRQVITSERKWAANTTV